MKVNDVEVKQVFTQVGQRIQLTVTTDNIPARALLDRGEARMLARHLIDLANAVTIKVAS
jgi:hypothetical protein